MTIFVVTLSGSALCRRSLRLVSPPPAHWDQFIL